MLGVTKCLQLVHFTRECNVKTVDDKARYSAFKVTEVKSDEPKALVSVDSMVNWSDHTAENKTGEVEKVYGMMAGLHADNGGADASNGGADASNGAAEFDMMGISPKAQNEKKEWEVKYEATLARFDKWKESSKNLKKIDNTSTKLICPALIPSDKSSDSETYASCDSRLKTKTKDFPLLLISDLPESDVEDPNYTDGSPSFSLLENVNLLGLLNFSASVPADGSDPAASRTDQQSILLVTLGGIKDQNFGRPRVMVDLINPHGFTLKDPQGRLKSEMAWVSQLIVGAQKYDRKQGKLDVFVQVKEALSKFGGGGFLEVVEQILQKACMLQRKKMTAKDAAARYGYLFSQATAEILCQAEAEIRNQGVSAVRDPAGIDSAVRDPAGIDSAVRDTAAIDSAGGVSAGSPSAGSDPADSFQPAGSFEPADESNPAVSSSVSADFNPVYADESTLPPGQQLGSSENTTRFPVPSDVCMDKLSIWLLQIFLFYDDDFKLKNLSLVTEDFIEDIQDQQRTNHTDQLLCLFGCIPFYQSACIGLLVPVPVGNHCYREKGCDKSRGMLETVFGFASLPHGLSGISVGRFRVAFLYGEIEEEVVMSLSLKALKILTSTKHVIPSEETGTIDKTHCLSKKDSWDILLVQVKFGMSAMRRVELLLTSTRLNTVACWWMSNFWVEVNFMAVQDSEYVGTSSTEARHLMDQDLQIWWSYWDGESLFRGICEGGGIWCFVGTMVLMVAMDYAAGSVYMLVGILLLVDSFLLNKGVVFHAYAGFLMLLILLVGCHATSHLVLLVVSNHAGRTLYLLPEYWLCGSSAEAHPAPHSPPFFPVAGINTGGGTAETEWVEREEEEVPLRRKRSVYRRARTEFYTPAFEQFQTPLSTDVLSQAAVSASAGPSVVADKGKAPMPDLDIPAEFVAEDEQEYMPNVSEERAKELDELMMRMIETDWLNLMMQVGSNPALARELLGADVTEENFVERMTAIKDREASSGSLHGVPAPPHNGTISMTAVRLILNKQLIEEYENICRRLEKDRLLSAQYNLFRPKPAISEPPSKRQRVARASSQPSNVPAATTQPADDHDSAGGSSFHPAGSAPPLSGSAAPTSAGGVFGVPDSTVSTSAAMDSAGSHRESGVSPFADSADSSSPSPVSTDHIPIDVLFASTSEGITEFFLDSDEDEQIGMSRVAADPDSDDEVLAEILFRGQYISGAGVVVVDKLPDDEIVDPRVKVETVSAYASSPPRSRRKHRGVRSDDFLWDKPVEDFFSSESESDDDMENYIPPLPYGAFKDWEIVRCPLSTTYYHVYYQENRRQKSFFYLKQLLPHVYREDLLLLRRRMNRYFRLNPDVDVGLDLWRDVNLLCQSLHSDDVEDFWRTQDDWIVSSWKLYPKSSVHVLDLTNGKTVFIDRVYPIRATLLERMLSHKLTVPPSYCRDVVVAGSVIQTVQASLRESYECLASVPIACTARQMVFNSPWLTAEKEFGSPLQTALVCNSNPLIAVKTFSNPLYGCDGLPKTVRVFQFTLDSRSEKLDWLLLHQDWKLLLRDVAASFDSAVHRVHAVSFDAAVASTVSAACCVAAGYIVCWFMLLLLTLFLLLLNPLTSRRSI
ncbi:hypothetical protein Tco_0024009 [Tanacetum coccineum]